MKKMRKLFACLKTGTKKVANGIKAVAKKIVDCGKAVGTFLFHCAKAVIAFPHKVLIGYRKAINSDIVKRTHVACIVLDEYAREVLEREIVDDESFKFAKYMYLKHREHRYDIKGIVVCGVKAMISFAVTYTYIVLPKETIWKGFAAEEASFAVFFLVAFYIPAQVEYFITKMRKRDVAIKDMDYTLYLRHK